MPKCGDKINPGSLASEGSPEPAQELDSALGEAQGASSKGWENTVVFDGESDFALDALGAALEFGFGADAVILLKHVFEDEHELMGKADKSGLHGFGGRRGGPCFGFSELVLEFVENLFDVPASASQFGENAGRQGHFTGDKDTKGCGDGVFEGNATHKHTGGAFALLVAFDSGIARVEGIPREVLERGQDHVLFLLRKKIDAAEAFPTVPSLEVDASLVINMEHFASLGSSQAQTVKGLTFESAHVVLVFTLHLIGDREVMEEPVAQIKGVKVAARRFRTLREGRPVMSGASCQ